MPGLMESQDTTDWERFKIVIASKIAGTHETRQPHVIYQCVARATAFYDPNKPNSQIFKLLAV
jgi:hypothetical protein